MLRDGTPYVDLGPQHFAEKDRSRTARRLVNQLKALGLEVQVKEAA